MKLGRNLALWMISMVTLISMVSAWFYYRSELSEEAEKLRVLGETMGPLVEESFGNYMITRNKAVLDMTLEKLKNMKPISRVLLVNNSGIIKAGTDPSLIGSRMADVDPDAHRFFSRYQKGKDGIISSGKDVFKWLELVENRPQCLSCHNSADKYNGFLVIDFSISEFEEFVKKDLFKGFSVLIPSIIIIGAAMLFLSNFLIIRRLASISGRMSKFKEGNYDIRIPLDGDDEITRLQESFNDMAVTINERDREKTALFDQISAAHRLWQNTFDSITDLVAIVDEEMRIIKTNNASYQFFGLSPEDAAGRKFCGLIFGDDPEGADCLDGKKVSVTEVSSPVMGRILRISLFPFQASEYADEGTILIARDITEEKRNEAALRQSDEKRKMIIENINEIVYMVSFGDEYDRGNVEFVSPRSMDIIGYAPEEFIRDPNLWISLVHPEDLSAVSRSFSETSNNAASFIRIYRIRHKATGNYLWMEDKIVPQLDSSGKLSGFFGVARDITERRNAEEELSRNYVTQAALSSILGISLKDISTEEILERALDLILSMKWMSEETSGTIFIIDRESGLLSMKAQKGLTEDACLSCANVPVGRCLCGRAAETLEIQFASSIDERHEITYDNMRPHGHYCVPMVMAGNAIGIINIMVEEGHIRDDRETEFLAAMANALAGIVHRKQVEADHRLLIGELRKTLDTVSRSRKMWEETFDGIGDLISVHDENHGILRVNRAFADYFGVSPKYAVGKKCFEFFHESDSPYHSCPQKVSFRENRPASIEFVDKKRNRIFKITTFPLPSHEHGLGGMIHIAKDITEEREKEMRLIMTERLASLGQMASGIAHEINNPLASIAGCSEGLLNRVRQGRFDQALFDNYLGIIQEEIMRCKSITTSMLSFVRKTTYEKKAVDIHETLEKTIEVIGFQGRMADVEVVRRYAGNLPLVHGSEGELKQVFLSLISNALDAMDDRGTITIETGAEEGFVTISIGDTGCGIPEDRTGRIFDPFFTTKSDRGGTGLGLSITAKIVGNHGGTISVSSREEEGTTFRISLPALKE